MGSSSTSNGASESASSDWLMSCAQASMSDIEMFVCGGIGGVGIGGLNGGIGGNGGGGGPAPYFIFRNE